MIMSIINENKIIRNFSITEEKKEIIEKFLLLSTEQSPHGTTIDDILRAHEVIIDFGEFAKNEVF